jgi:hypothetical protein
MLHAFIIAVAIRAVLLVAPPADDVRVLSSRQVQEIYLREAGTTPPVGLNAFRLQNDPKIYVNAESKVYKQSESRPGEFHALRLAATILHERVHETDGEYAARRRQADFVRSQLRFLPSSQRRDADRYWRTLEGRALSLAIAEGRLRR